MNKGDYGILIGIHQTFSAIIFNNETVFVKINENDMKISYVSDAL